MGCSDPLGKMCEITAPRPNAEESATNFNGNIGP